MNENGGTATTQRGRRRRKASCRRPPIRSPASRRSTSFPASTRVYLRTATCACRCAASRSGGEPPFDVYDTSGPQGVDPHQGLPKLRQPWIEARIARGDTNLSQMHYARRGDHHAGDAVRRAARERHARVRARRGRARPRDHAGQHQPPRERADDHRPQLPGEDQRQHRQLGGHARRSTRRSTSCAGRSAGAPTR